MTDTSKPGHMDPRRIGQLGWAEAPPIQPTQDHVQLRLEPPKETQGGILIPVSAQRKEALVEATVLAVGPGAFDKRGRRIPMPVKAGDRVLVGGDAGWELGSTRMLRVGAIQGVVE